MTRWTDCWERPLERKGRAARRAWHGERVESDLRDSDDKCMIDGGVMLARMANVLPTIVRLSHLDKGEARKSTGGKEGRDGGCERREWEKEKERKKEEGGRGG